MHKLEHYNCFIIQHIYNKSQFREKLSEIYNLLISKNVYYNILPRVISYTTSSEWEILLS